MAEDKLLTVTHNTHTHRIRRVITTRAKYSGIYKKVVIRVHTFLMSSSASSFSLIMMWLTHRLAKTIAGICRMLSACFFTMGP